MRFSKRTSYSNSEKSRHESTRTQNLTTSHDSATQSYPESEPVSPQKSSSMSTSNVSLRGGDGSFRARKPTKVWKVTLENIGERLSISFEHFGSMLFSGSDAHPDRPTFFDPESSDQEAIEIRSHMAALRLRRQGSKRILITYSDGSVADETNTP